MRCTRRCAFHDEATEETRRKRNERTNLQVHIHMTVLRVSMLYTCVCVCVCVCVFIAVKPRRASSFRQTCVIRATSVKSQVSRDKPRHNRRRDAPAPISPGRNDRRVSSRITIRCMHSPCSLTRLNSQVNSQDSVYYSR